jgi:HK97 family phage portal protein
VRVEETQGTFTTWSGDAYADDTFRGAVDSIARNAAKLKASHIVTSSNGTKPGSDSTLTRLLQVRPNPFMNSYDFVYKVVTHLYLYNNSFAVIDRDQRGNVCGFYPLDAATAEYLQDDAGNVYVHVTAHGRDYVFAHGDVIHLRRDFNADPLFGDSNDAIGPTLELAHTQNEGIVNGIKSGASIRGILRFTQIMAPEKLKAEKQAFIDDYLSMDNDGGVVTLDQKMEYTPIDSKPISIDPEQLQQVKTRIYNYLGISEAIVNSTYNEDQWGAFYESVIEPLALQMSLEFTEKVFTQREQAFGNQIVFDSNRLQYASVASKTDLISKLSALGLLTTNQALEILNLPPVEDGDRRLQSLNYVDSQNANDYQLAQAGATSEGGNE